MSRVAWAVCGVLGLGVAANLGMVLSEAPTHTTLPIFVPVTLEMERAMRSQRGQPPGRGGEEAVILADALLAEDLDATTAAALSPEVEELRRLRQALLDARNRRHLLNTNLMNVGVAVAGELDAAQWSDVDMRRDALRVEGDDAVFERLLTKLRASP